MLHAVVTSDCPASGRARWPLHDVDASRCWEAVAAQGLPTHALMQRAGLATARLALALAPHDQTIDVICGPGNNGGDGLLAAAHLHRAGKAVQVWLLSTDRPPADAADALRTARESGVPITVDQAITPRTSPQGLVIDAMFGIGLRRAPQGLARRMIDALRASESKVLAVDVPSGLDADTGQPIDALASVGARWTLSLLTLKPGLFTAQGRDRAGEVWFDDLDVTAPDASATGQLISDTSGIWPNRHHHQHKGSFGDVWVVGGAAGMRGALWLAGRSALVAGAGRVMGVPADDSSAVELDPLHPELMLRSTAALTAHSTPLESATVVCGCGGGTAVAALLPGLIARAGRLVLDADALNALAADRSLARGLAARHARDRPTILTPHPLEAARWFGVTAAEVQADRIGCARRLAADARAHVVLKGSGTVIASPDGSVCINASGNSALGSAGTGDVLAGWIAGLWSQGLDPDRACQLGVHSHGRAADRWWQTKRPGTPLEAGQLIEQLRASRD